MSREDQAWQFANDVIKPWQDLDRLLVLPFCHDPTRSDASRLAASLAVNIKHQADRLFSGDPLAVKKFVDGPMRAHEPARLMSDFADKSKHFALRDKKREVTMTIRSVFETDGARHYRFLGHKLLLDHVGLGECDFMVESAAAIGYWAEQRRFKMQAPLNPTMTQGPWLRYAGLVFDPQHSVQARQMTVLMLKRNETGELVPFDGDIDLLATPRGTPQANEILGL